MATYYNDEGMGSEIQAHQESAMHTLYLMNPTFVTAPSLPLETGVLHHHHQQRFAGIQFSAGVGSSNSDDERSSSSRLSPHHQIHAAFQGLSWGPMADQRGLSLSLSGGPRGGRGVTVQSVILGSRYLKAVQEVLEEVVSVGDEITKPAISSSEKHKMKMKMKMDSVPTPGNGAAEQLTTAQRQELHMKKAKLVTMLDEVEQRYRQYHHQMQIVMSSFEQVAGFGSSKSYTALALQTISKQFRCLKDAISSTIKATGKSLGEDQGEECLGSRLRYVDHQLRQQRALQQLGMIQHNNSNNNAWRPQRGLPERAVSVLRAWLFEHFLHPYPKDSDKVMLAKQTGLTRSQVSNWFINARVRLWKPMVEEMYLEETKDQKRNDNEKNDKNKIQVEANQISHSAARSLSTSPTGGNNNNNNPQPLLQSKKQRSTTSEIAPNISSTPSSSTILSMDMEYAGNKFGNSQVQTKDFSAYNNNSFINVASEATSATTGFGAYPNINGHDQLITRRFHGNINNNGVSLTLGRPHDSSLGAQQQSYLSNSNSNNNMAMGIRRLEDIESMELQNRERFAAQLMPDFVT